MLSWTFNAGERLNGIQEVVGSIPIVSTKNNKPQGQKALWFIVLTSALAREATCGASCLKSHPLCGWD